MTTASTPRRILAGMACAALVVATTSAQATWQQEASMSHPRLGFGSVSHGGKLYAFFGIDDLGNYLTDFDVFDPVTGTWSLNTSSSFHGLKRSNVRAVSLNGFIYVLGGTAPGVSYADVWRYEPCTDSWKVCASMPASRINSGVVAMSGKIYVLGGRSWPGWTYHNTVFVYDPTRDYATSPFPAWTPGVPHPGRLVFISGHNELGDCSALARGGQVVVMGGMTGSGGFSDAVDEVWLFDPDATVGGPAWTYAGSMPLANFGLALQNLYGFTVGTGGHGAWTGSVYNPLSTGYAFPTPTALASPLTTQMPVPAEGSGVIDGRIYIFGGQTGWGTGTHGQCWSFQD